MSDSTTTDMRNQHGAFSWAELTTPDPKAAAEFYQHVLGWTSKEEDIGVGPYTCFFNQQGTAIAGAMAPMPDAPDNAPPQWTMYVTVDDVDAVCAAATNNGGSVPCPPVDIPTVGRIAHITDPHGASIAVITYETPLES